jgi:hypothetical protein
LAALPLDRADPAGLIQRALGGFPTGYCCADQIVLAWLMTLPPDVAPPRAARSLLNGRLPRCRQEVAPAIDAVRGLLRFIAAHDPR